MSCQCLFLPRQEIRECVCWRRTQQHSHGNASTSSSVPRLRSTMRPYSSLLHCLGPRLQSTHPHPFSSVHIILLPLSCGSLLLKSPSPHLVNIWRSTVLLLWCVGTVYQPKNSDTSMCLSMHVCVTLCKNKLHLSSQSL